MLYALNENSTGFRAINSPDDLLPGETLCDGVPTLAIVPERITEIAAWKYKIVVELLGMTAAIDAYISGLTEPEKTITTQAYNGKETFLRSSYLIEKARVGLSLTTAQVDRLFIAADSIDVDSMSEAEMLAMATQIMQGE